MNCLVGKIHLLHNWNANRSDCRLICSNLANLRTAPSCWDRGRLCGLCLSRPTQGAVQGQLGERGGFQRAPCWLLGAPSICRARCLQSSGTRLWLSRTLGGAVFTRRKGAGSALTLPQPWHTRLFCDLSSPSVPDPTVFPRSFEVRVL